jgi:tetratricopeptide (TPR) repeat protein
MVDPTSEPASDIASEQKESVIGRSPELDKNVEQPIEQDTTATLHEILDEAKGISFPHLDKARPRSQPAVDSTRLNWRIQQLYSRGEYDECLALIEKELIATKGLCEHGYHVKGLIRRHQGKVDESLELFQAAAYLNPTNASNLKQTARSLFLLGKHAAALDVYNETQELSDATRNDWEIWHFKGMYLVRIIRVGTNKYSYRPSTSLSMAC